MWPFWPCNPIYPASFPAPRRSPLRSPASNWSHQATKTARPNSAKQMTLETNERRRRRLSFVRAGTHGIQPPPSPTSWMAGLDAPRGGGGGIKKYRRRIFVSVSQTILLNGSRKALEEASLERKNAFSFGSRHPSRVAASNFSYCTRILLRFFEISTANCTLRCTLR